MNAAVIAAQDQTDAREREFDRTAQRVAGWLLIVAAGLAGYSLLGLSGDVPLPSWSAVGSRADGFSPFAVSLGLGLVVMLVGLRATFRAFDLTRARLGR